MMKQEIQCIEQLLERFFEGETSNAEEQKLYQFFAGDSVPGHLMKYKQMFEYFDSGIRDEDSVEQMIIDKPKKRVWLAILSVAASVAILIGAGLFLIDKSDSIDPYQGSYIIRNGVVVYDLDLIKERETAIQAKIEQKQYEMNSLLEYISNENEEYERLEQLTK